MSGVTAIPFQHRGLGPMIRLGLGESLRLEITLLEERTLSRALAAVGAGKSKVDEIYLSPIASDGDFLAKVALEGLIVEGTSPALKLGWQEVERLAALLADLAPEHPSPPTERKYFT